MAILPSFLILHFIIFLFFDVFVKNRWKIKESRDLSRKPDFRIFS